MFRYVIAAALSFACTSIAGARSFTISPSSPTAMEFVHLYTTIGGECERVRGVEPVEGGFRIVFDRYDLGLRCDEVLTFALTLGGFAPGTYRISSRVYCNGCAPAVYDDPRTLTFTVLPAAASAAPGDDVPQADLSGIWTTPSEAYTGFAFVHSGSVGAQGRELRVTGFWYDYSGSQATWSMLLLDGSRSRLAGTVVRAVPSGTGASRTIALAPAGNATLERDAAGNWRLSGNVEQRSFDFPVERFRWARAAWPGPAPAPR
jgi:hypothetical protein